MTYVDVQYISVARKNEVDHHEHTMKKLRAQVSHLTKAVAWEMEQHHSRLKELQQMEDILATDKTFRPAINPFIVESLSSSQLEDTLSLGKSFTPPINTPSMVEPQPSSQLEDTPSMDSSPIPAMNIEPILEPAPSKPTPSPRRRRTKTKKTVNRSIQEPVAELVG